MGNLLTSYHMNKYYKNNIVIANDNKKNKKKIKCPYCNHYFIDIKKHLLVCDQKQNNTNNDLYGQL